MLHAMVINIFAPTIHNLAVYLGLTDVMMATILSMFVMIALAGLIMMLSNGSEKTILGISIMELCICFLLSPWGFGWLDVLPFTLFTLIFVFATALLARDIGR